MAHSNQFFEGLGCRFDSYAAHFRKLFHRSTTHGMATTACRSVAILVARPLSLSPFPPSALRVIPEASTSKIVQDFPRLMRSLRWSFSPGAQHDETRSSLLGS